MATKPVSRRKQPRRPQIEALPLASVRADDQIQPRATGLTAEIVEEYADAYLSGRSLPPGIVFRAGFHRDTAGAGRE